MNPELQAVHDMNTLEEELYEQVVQLVIAEQAIQRLVAVFRVYPELHV